MGLMDTAKLIRNAQQTRSKMKNTQGVGTSKSGLTAVSINGVYEVDIEFEDELLEGITVDRLKKEVLQAYKAAKKDLEQQLAESFDMNSLKDMVG